MAKPSEEQNDRCSQCEESSRCVRERQHQGNAVVPYRCLTKCKSDSIPQRRGYLIARHLAGMCHRFTALPAGLRQGNQTIPQSSYSKWLFVSDADIFHSKTPCPSEPWSGQRNAMPVPLFWPALPRVTVVMGLLTGKFPGVNCSGSAHMVPRACLQPAQPLHPTERTFHQKKKLLSGHKAQQCPEMWWLHDRSHVLRTRGHAWVMQSHALPMGAQLLYRRAQLCPGLSVVLCNPKAALHDLPSPNLFSPRWTCSWPPQ